MTYGLRPTMKQTRNCRTMRQVLCPISTTHQTSPSCKSQPAASLAFSQQASGPPCLVLLQCVSIIWLEEGSRPGLEHLMGGAIALSRVFNGPKHAFRRLPRPDSSQEWISRGVQNIQRLFRILWRPTIVPGFP